MASQRDLVEGLLALAAEDAVAAGAMLDVGVVTDRIVSFHAQQVVEEALKAVTVRRLRQRFNLPEDEGSGWRSRQCTKLAAKPDAFRR